VHKEGTSSYHIKASVICTVKNEEGTILDWLKSLEKQSKIPDEVIIVDGGSTDRTVDLIKEFMRNSGLNIRLIVSPGANIAQGRNIAVKNSIYDIIASTDAGCKLHPRWFENIIKPFEEDPSVDVVSGVYLPWYENEFQEVAGYIIFPEVDKLDPKKFLPSSRSVAFKKEAWRLIGGYPECLYTAEDTLFDLKLRKMGMKFALARNAIVYWRIRRNLKGIFKQYFNYAKGDGIALIRLKKFILLYSLLMFLIGLIMLFWDKLFIWITIASLVLVGLWYKWVRKVKRKNFRRIMYGYLVTLAIVLGLCIGYIVGLINRMRNSQLRCSLKEWWSIGVKR